MTLKIFIDLLISSLQEISVLALATMGIVLIFKTSFTTNFAQGSISVFGAYLTTELFYRNDVNFFLSIVMGVIVGFITGIIIDTLIIRKARNVTSVGKQMITMGLVLVFAGIIPLIFGAVPVTVDRLRTFAPGSISWSMFGETFSITRHALISISISVVVIAGIFAALKFTKWGLGVRATASSELVSGMMGINTRIITALSWAIAGGIGSMAAIMYFHIPRTIGVSAMIPYQINAFMASILGGFSTFFGPIVGAVLIPATSTVVGYQYSVWKNVIVYVLILIVILIRPYGLFGKKIQKKV